MPAATLEALEQRLAAVEQKIAQLEQSKPETKPKKSVRDRLLEFMAEGPHLSTETAEQLRKDIQEAKWEGLENKKPLLPLTGKPGSRDRVLEAMAKLKPISQEDADMINTAIREAREQSIADSLSS